MSDAPPISAPQLSEDTLSYERGLLNDPIWCQQFPAHAAVLRRTLDTATALTGQNITPVSDGRSPAQVEFDRRFGVTPSALPLPLASLVASSEPTEAVEAEAVIVASGRSYADVLRDARAALNHAKSPADPTK